MTHAAATRVGKFNTMPEETIKHRLPRLTGVRFSLVSNQRKLKVLLSRPSDLIHHFEYFQQSQLLSQLIHRER